MRLLRGIFIAGLWPGMAYHLALFYPPSWTGKRIGLYFTAAQVSAAVVGLVSGGLPENGRTRRVSWVTMDVPALRPRYHYRGDFLALVAARPTSTARRGAREDGLAALVAEKPACAEGRRCCRAYRRRSWTLHDFMRVLMDWRLWPLVFMYFGVVGVGMGVQDYGTVIISA